MKKHYNTRWRIPSAKFRQRPRTVTPVVRHGDPACALVKIPGAKVFPNLLIRNEIHLRRVGGLPLRFVPYWI